MKDKTKVLLLSILFFTIVILLLGGIYFLVIRDNKNDKNNELSTTTRRTYTTTSSEPGVIDETTTSVVENPTTTTVVTGNNTTTKTTTKKVTTRAVTSYVKTTTTTTAPRVTLPRTSSTKTVNALNDWEWGIVDKINEQRAKNGLPNVGVVSELRDKAEDGAKHLYETGGDVNELKTYLKGYNAYGKLVQNMNTTYEGLYNSLEAVTGISSRKEINYVGIGVLKIQGTNEYAYYFVAIYQ